MPISKEQRNNFNSVIEASYKKWTGGLARDVKVLLSFGSAEGGFDYAMAMRAELMKATGWKNPLNVISTRSRWR